MRAKRSDLDFAEIEKMPVELQRIYGSTAFQALRTARRQLTIRLTLAMCAIYYGFILVVAFRPDLLAKKITAVISVGIPVSLGVIFSAVMLTGLYVWRANREFDPLAAEARASARP